MLRIPDPTPSPCPHCTEPTVVAEFATGPLRVHCGTYTTTCYRTDSRAASLRTASTTARAA